ncbi:HEAT repeat domain-containing protein [Ideonella sp. DXS29W]|uniref:HEAT repeat domain-containing protein n=1 Tax=Ideonella lacteola TaxID=2984193 RepID=A0ABU9BYC7_9BURK
MSPPESWFESAVAESWSQAVMAASVRYAEVRDQVVKALKSANPEVRSAAIATVNEANDKLAHDLVVRLANDPDTQVREEVMEYIEEFPQESDVGILLGSLKAGESLYLASSALRKILGNVGPLLDDEEADTRANAVAAWEEAVRFYLSDV